VRSGDVSDDDLVIPRECGESSILGVH
jgi:hypothetical protein